ncbi:MAG: hypothetical protein Q7S17_09045 [Xanthobacteraceae bacterium]|nr:hypothetical protein [Xanthobacteraceae bacterium]
MPLLTTIAAASSMGGLVALLVPIIVIVIVALIIWAINERFAPDPLIKQIVQYVLFGVVLIVLIMKLFPLLGFN